MSLSTCLTCFRRCALVSVLALVACRGEQIEGAEDAGGTAESGVDAGGVDVSVDDAPDDGSDGTTDAGPDATNDAATDGGSDGLVDAAGDTDPVDSAGDASPSDAFVAGPMSQADCPIARGPKMKFISAPEPFCIDETEVTDAHFSVFRLASDKPKEPTLPDYCVARLAELTSSGPYSTTLPAVNTEWCWAYAYCKWAGKRLCGKHGGGAYASSESEASGTSQWTYACRGGDPGSMYPYDTSAHIAGKCIDATSGATSVQPVDSSTWSGCHGSGEFSTLMHMSGNAREWEDACDGPIGASTSCRTRGGAFNSPWNQANCGSLLRLNTNADATTGFRCCFDGR